ncbi:DUF1254 domain-containing protein [Geminocystis sp. GBBB08]|uniref:DUF1254 domain-containing protein n=1 Tax=Geminocystis sp. GBBB08 TaxID=2604140 RepID=UPI0027E29C2A|nr:DUF1254 domain-containing protein [Geminocystis sp. GBBB08]MBL1209747.1 DUF1254 domain-containing protein [Geminocystis sp. GBBB08]
MNNISEQEAYEIGIEAYHYFYPLITMDFTRRVCTNYKSGEKPGFGPVNTFHHLRQFPPANFRAVVRPNFDTLYTVAWVDITKEPMIVLTPDTNGRYYLLPMLDMWSNVFAVPGKRTTGTQAQQYAIVPQGWTGELSEAIEKIESPTPHIWIIGRIQTNGVEDYPAVNEIQDGFKIVPLSQWGKTFEPVEAVIDPTLDMETDPLKQVNSMSASQYFSYGAELMKLHSPHITDWSIIARLQRIGIQQGKSFDLNKAPVVLQNSLQKAVIDGLKIMMEKLPTLARIENGWQMNTDTMGVYGNYYLKRAIVAMVGLGANQPEDAIYPMNVFDSNGKPMKGENNYILHFDKDELPPVEAFWSITMYDAEGFQVANKLDRFAIGDRDALKYNSDGSLDIYIQHESPEDNKVSNWLPSPAEGVLGVTMRLYAPKSSVLNGVWNPPPVKQVD